MLSSALRGDAGDGTLDDFEQRLLHTLAADVARNGHVLALSRDFVDFVDVDYTDLRFFDVAVRRLNEFEQDILDVFADIARFGERGCVGNRKGHVEYLRERLGKQSLTRTRGSEQENVAFLEHHAVIVASALVYALVMVVDGDGKHLFGTFLSDDVFVEFLLYLLRSVERHAERTRGILILCDEVHTLLDALVANGYVIGSDDYLLDFAVGLSAETALQFFLKTVHITSLAEVTCGNRKSCRLFRISPLLRRSYKSLCPCPLRFWTAAVPCLPRESR